MPTATIHQSGLRIVIPTPQARSHQNQRRADRRSSEPTQAHAPPRGSTSGHGIRFSMDQLQSRAVKAAAAPHLAREHAPTNWPSTGTRIREACAATQEPPTHENVDRAGFRHQRVHGPGRNGLGSAPRAGTAPGRLWAGDTNAPPHGQATGGLLRKTQGPHASPMFPTEAHHHRQERRRSHGEQDSPLRTGQAFANEALEVPGSRLRSNALPQKSAGQERERRGLGGGVRAGPGLPLSTESSGGSHLPPPPSPLH